MAWLMIYGRQRATAYGIQAHLSLYKESREFKKIYGGFAANSV